MIVEVPFYWVDKYPDRGCRRNNGGFHFPVGLATVLFIAIIDMQGLQVGSDAFYPAVGEDIGHAEDFVGLFDFADAARRDMAPELNAAPNDDQ